MWRGADVERRGDGDGRRRLVSGGTCSSVLIFDSAGGCFF